MKMLEERWRILPLAALTMVALACAGGETGEGEAGMEETAGEAETMPVDLASAATVSGSIMFEGTAPEPVPIDMEEEPACAEKYENGPVRETVVVNDNGTLRWVFVYVKSGQTADGQALADLSFPTPSEPVALDQDGCRYTPHVFGIQVGQTLEIMNSDGLLHNINAKPQQQRGFNISQPVEMTSTRTFDAPEVMVPIECDVHGWMQAFAGVLPHPYSSVSSETGSFEISQLPPGTYTIEAWHEEYGTQTQEVTVGANETAELTFTFSAPSA